MDLHCWMSLAHVSNPPDLFDLLVLQQEQKCSSVTSHRACSYNVSVRENMGAHNLSQTHHVSVNRSTSRPPKSDGPQVSSALINPPITNYQHTHWILQNISQHSSSHPATYPAQNSRRPSASTHPQSPSRPHKHPAAPASTQQPPQAPVFMGNGR